MLACTHPVGDYHPLTQVAPLSAYMKGFNMDTHPLADVLEQIKNGDAISIQDLSEFLKNHHQPGMTFIQTNLVSDGFVDAAHKDSNLINPWGVSFSSTSPLWVSDAGAGVTTIYDGEGNPIKIAGHEA